MCYRDLKDVDIFLLDFFKACYFDKFKDITKVKKSNLISNFREIFHKLTDKKDNYQIAVEFVDKALKYLELYHELFKSEKKYQHSNYKNVNKIIVGLNLLNYKSIKPILVSMLLVNREGNYFLENEIFIFIDKLYKYYLLKLTIGGEQANFIENDFKKIMVVTLKYKLAFLKLDNNKKNDDDFLSIIKLIEKMNSYFSDVKKISQEIIDYERGYEDNNIIKWYLYSIMTVSYENEDISLHNINLEHVMPIKYKEWETKDKFWKNKEHSIEDYIYKLGNCTLLHEKLNKSISNKIFSEKCEKLFNKELLNKKSSWLSKDESTFGDYTVKRIWKENKNWDKDVIEKRDQMIKDKIIETNLFKFDI